MLHRSERILDNIPVGSLGIIAVDGCEEMGNKVNDSEYYPHRGKVRMIVT